MASNYRPWSAYLGDEVTPTPAEVMTPLDDLSHDELMAANLVLVDQLAQAVALLKEFRRGQHPHPSVNKFLRDIGQDK